MNFKRIIAAILALAMTTSSFNGLGTTIKASEKKEVSEKTSETVKTDTKKKTTNKKSNVELNEVDKDRISADLYAKYDNDKETLDLIPDDDELVKVIIMGEDKSVIETNAKAKLNLITKIQRTALELKQNYLIKEIETKVFDGEELDVNYQYSWLLNGIATSVPYGMIEEIEAIDGVDHVMLQPQYLPADGEVVNSNVRTNADGVMIGREDTWASGYTGKGIKISVIDTGLDDDHQNFAAMDESCLTADSTTKESIAKVLPSLNATKAYPNLTVDQVYRSNKVAFGFNYVDESLVINHSADSMGEHGTHVAGIACANDIKNGEAVGVAPDAQLYVMKIFGANGGAYAEDILASLEDSLLLDADVINMSLGASAGFTSESDEADAIYARVQETDTILAVAAGNATTSASGNNLGTDTNLTSNPDNSIISSPATYQSVTSVASIENVLIKSNYIEVDGKKFGYENPSEGKNEDISKIAGESYDFAMVDNCGQTLEDFTNANVEGKIAVVSRGVTNFADKHQLAQDAGAIAIMIYNNTAGTLSVGLTGGEATIPCVSLTLSAGECLKDFKANNPEGKLYIATERAMIPNEQAWHMSDFTSWGPSPDLSLEPDITGPGGNIYSTLDGGKYGIMSGTSMATPNVAGIAALVMQYVKTMYPDMSDSDIHDYVNALLLSTSKPAVYDKESGLTYSPRVQGSGLADAFYATKTNAYLSVDNNEMPKAELFDDVNKTGKYNFTYHVNNFADHSIYYELNTNIQTEDVFEDEGQKFMALTPIALDGTTKETSDNFVYTYDYDGNGVSDSHDARELYLVSVAKTKAMEANAEFRYEVDKTEGSNQADVQAYLDALVGKESEANLQQQVLKVEANSKASVNVSIELSTEGKKFLDDNYENGGYVEGYTYLNALSSGEINLSMPYLGFYGDWTQAPILDAGYYWDDAETNNASQYWNIVWTSIQGTDWLPGLNPYLEDEPFDVANITMSPNEDGITDSIADIYLSLLRNANTVEISFTNKETQEVYYKEVYDKAVKTYLYTAGGYMLPFAQSQYGRDLYDFSDGKGNPVANDSVVTMKIATTLDFHAHEANNVSDTWELDFNVDTQAPEVISANVVVEGEKQYLDLTFKDNQKVAAVCFLNKAGAVVKARYGVESAKGEEVTQRYEITGYGNEFMIVLGDYAVNETYYEVKTTNNIPAVNKDLLYGYRVATDSIYDDSLYGWVAVDVNERNEANEIVVKEQDSEYYVDYALQAAEYIDGRILAVNAGGQLVSLTPGVWDDRSVIADYGVEIKDITYDPVDKVLYGYTGGKDDVYEIVKIDILTGELTGLGELYTWWNNRPYALSCDNEGNLYGIDSKGLLRTINKETGEWNEDVLLETGLEPLNVQSMTYNPKDNCIYWAAHLMDETAHLYTIDLDDNYKFTKVGTLYDSPELTGLVFLNDKEFDIPEADATSIDFTLSSVAVLNGTSTQLSVKQTPWYSNTGDLVWSTSDDSIASVDIRGNVTGKKEGIATITVASKDIPGLSATCEVRVIQPKTDLYGFAIGSMAGYANQWLQFNAGKVKVVDSTSDVSKVTYAAAEYYDGTIYGYNSSTEFFKIDPVTFKETKISNPDTMWSLKDMAFDYSSGYMFAIATKVGWDNLTYLVHVDLQTGLIEQVGEYPIEDSKGGQPITLAISTEGTLYMVTDTGFLCECVGDKFTVSGSGDDSGDGGIGWPDDGIGWLSDKLISLADEFIDEEESDQLTLKTIGVTGVTHINGLTSMTYDHNSGNMYYNYADGINAEQFALIDTVNGNALTIGSVAGGTQLVGLFAIPNKEVLPTLDKVEVSGISTTCDTLNLVTGMQIAAPVNVQPFNATNRDITWEMSEEGIVTIENNVVKAIKKGNVTITAKVGEFSTSFDVRVYESAGDIKGFVVYDFMYEDTNIWATFNDSDLSTGNGLANAENYGVDAAEYYNGKVYAYDNMNGQYLILNSASEKYEVEKRIKLSHPDFADMAFDYSQGVMYAISCVRNVDTNTSLYAINIADGSFYKIGNQNVTLKAITCSTDGTLYGVDKYGAFYQIDKQSGMETYLFDTGYEANVYQSMAYDHNTGNIYWSQCYWNLEEGSYADLVLIDPANEVSIELGKVGAAGCQVTGLYIDPKQPIEIQTPQIEAIKLNTTNMMLELGESQTLQAFPQPLSVKFEGTKFEYTSIDDSIVSVDDQGNVKALKAGTTFVVVTHESGIEAVCQVTVLDDSSIFYVINPSGFETSPVLKPSTILDKTVFAEHNPEFGVVKATLNNDGYFYAVGTDGYLWKYTADMSLIERIGDKKVLDQLSNAEDLWWLDNPTITLRALSTNTFTGEVYSIVQFVDTWGNLASYVYQIDLTSGASTLVRDVPYDIVNPTALTFDSAKTMIIYDGNNDYIYRVAMNLNEEGDGDGDFGIEIWSDAHDFDDDFGVGGAEIKDCEPIAWAQGTVVSTEDIAMYYSAVLNRVFVTTTNESPYATTITMDLYVLNLEDQSFTKLGQAAYNQQVKGIAMAEGIILKNKDNINDAGDDFDFGILSKEDEQ